MRQIAKLWKEHGGIAKLWKEHKFSGNSQVMKLFLVNFVTIVNRSRRAWAAQKITNEWKSDKTSHTKGNFLDLETRRWNPPAMTKSWKGRFRRHLSVRPMIRLSGFWYFWILFVPRFVFCQWKFCKNHVFLQNPPPNGSWRIVFCRC